MNLQLRALQADDASVIAEAFREQGWDKPAEKYRRYRAEQLRGERVTIVAELDGAFAGYVNVLWHSAYPYFQELGIPEINDFNVLMRYRRMGIGTKLMDRAEVVAGERSPVVGIGVGVFSDYGNAQVLYAKRGYVPDGRGVHNGERYVGYGDTVEINDDLVFYLTKRL
ncbi:GNAT family N-acetyltransferase [Paenibacillus sp. TRM 82003]|nr:GNAT family N-acetyltransferase [Paenibacillus sp. TRM 82003]